MPDPGYGPNGEYIAPVGATVWEAIGPATPVTAGDDRHQIYALGIITVPFIDQDDDDVWKGTYMGGVPT
jgi:hypothetical protein